MVRIVRFYGPFGIGCDSYGFCAARRFEDYLVGGVELQGCRFVRFKLFLASSDNKK